MIRSQSLSNLNEQKKFRGGFFSSWKSRKPSKNEAKIDTIPENEQSNDGKTINKRLSQSISTQSLGLKARESSERNNGKRNAQYSSRAENNKENLNHTTQPSKVRASGIRISEPRTLDALEGSNQHRSKRNSTVLGPSTLPSNNKSIDILPEKSSLDKNRISSSTRRDIPPLQYKETNSPISKFESDDTVHYKPESDRFPTKQQLLDLTKVIDAPEFHKSSKIGSANDGKSYQYKSKELQNINECLQASLEKRNSYFVIGSKYVSNVLFLSFEDPKLQRNSFGYSLPEFNYDSELEDPSKNDFDDLF